VSGSGVFTTAKGLTDEKSDSLRSQARALGVSYSTLKGRLVRGEDLETGLPPEIADKLREELTGEQVAGPGGMTRKRRIGLTVRCEETGANRHTVRRLLKEGGLTLDEAMEEALRRKRKKPSAPVEKRQLSERASRDEYMIDTIRGIMKQEPLYTGKAGRPRRSASEGA
jgi:hypothetical protein